MSCPMQSRSVILAFLSLGLCLANGCSLTTGHISRTGSTPPAAIYPRSDVNSSLRVTTAPPGAEVWVGPGCQSGESTPSESPRRYLGHTPLTSRITTADLLPSGDLPYSIRYESSRHEGWVARADHILSQGGLVRIEAEFEPAAPIDQPVTK